MSNQHPRRSRIRVLHLMVILALALTCAPMVSAASSAPEPAPQATVDQAPDAVVNFPAGSLIIPMDTTYQNAGMWLAYGYIYRLLTNNIPVYWAIEPTKIYNGIDFTATNIVNARTNAAVAASVSYRGGPFVIHADNAAAAIALLTAPFATQPTVHKANDAFSSEVNIILRRAPRIAIEEINEDIAVGYMTAAGIPSTNVPGNPGYYLVDQAFINAGGLFQLGVCSSRKFDVYVTPHNGGFSYSLTNAANAGTLTYAALDYFVYQGGGWVALCESIPSNENAINDLYRNSNAAVRALFAPLPVTGGFLTVNGLDVANKNNGNDNTWVVDAANVDLPVAQIVPTSASPIEVPGGSVGTWRSPVTGSTNTQYWSQTERVAYFTESGLQYDHTINGVYHDGLGQGKMTMIGGHRHDTTAYNSNVDATFLKAFYNSLFFNGAAVANLGVFVLGPPPLVQTNLATPIQVELRNSGASVATNVQNVVITLEPGFVYNSTVGPAPTSVVGGGINPTVITWNSLPDVPGGAVALTLNVTTPAFPTTGIKKLASIKAKYGDVFGENFTAEGCQSIEVYTPPLAVPLADFSAVCVGATPAISWETVSELTNQGFNLYRGLDESNPDTQLNATMIPSQGPGSAQGFVYNWTDDTALPDTQYYYWLEDISFSGSTNMHGPIPVMCTAPTAVTVNELAASSTPSIALSGWMIALALGAMLAGFVVVRRMRTN